jgi:hypothetical protein
MASVQHRFSFACSIQRICLIVLLCINITAFVTSSESIVHLFCGPAMHGGVQQRPHSMALLYESCATFPLFARAKSCLSMLSTSAHFE